MTNKLWGSRFEGKTDPLADAFTFSLDDDRVLAKYDCIGSMAHAKMLGECGIIPKSDAARITSGLQTILDGLESGKFRFDPKAEDIHSCIQSELKRLIGKPAERLHTARSRNDQVVLDMKLYCLDHLSQCGIVLQELQRAVLKCARDNEHVIIPAYTHLQAAQAVLLAHHLLAYIEMLDRDKGRLLDAIKRTDRMPLGACALSGTSLPTDRKMVAKELGFADVTRNSIDTVSDRDFIIEALSGLAIIGVHFSRIAEDLILWATREFNVAEIPWAYCTGSSIMPHKKNPDVLELIRGESARLIADQNQLLVLLKGLPLTYNRDLQLDKPALFGAFERVERMARLLSRVFAGLKFNKEVLEERLEDEALYSVDIMEYLIEKGVTYREAHDNVGEMVKTCLDKGKRIKDLKPRELKKFSKHLEEDVKERLNAKASVKRKKSFGSTSPASVARELEQWGNALS